MTKVNQLKFEALYDIYSPMLNGIALQIAPTQKQAEQILITTFTKAHQQNIEEQKYPSPCVALINLLIQTAHEQVNNNIGKINFKLKQFENSPLLHHLLCEQATIENYCVENKITKQQAMKNFKQEFSLMINDNFKTYVSPKENEMVASNFVKRPLK